MKGKLIFKTILLTIGVIAILAVSVFGVVSLLAPVTMMEFTDSLGLKSMSGDYAYQEYRRSENISYLARSFIVAAGLEADRAAESRFEELYVHPQFDTFCAEQDEKIEAAEGLEGISYRAYLCGLATRVKYRLASSEEEFTAVLNFAKSETEASFPQSNPLIALTVEAAGNRDKAFCTRLRDVLTDGTYTENSDLQYIIAILEGVINE